MEGLPHDYPCFQKGTYTGAARKSGSQCWGWNPPLRLRTLRAARKRRRPRYGGLAPRRRGGYAEQKPPGCESPTGRTRGSSAWPKGVLVRKLPREKVDMPKS